MNNNFKNDIGIASGSIKAGKQEKNIMQVHIFTRI
jgi:hypothetical protein